MMKVIDFETMTNAMIAQTITVSRKIYPTLPEDFFSSLAKNFGGAFMREFAVPLYDKYFTHEEIVAMANFYTLPVGQSVLKKMPAMMGESMQQGAEWGRLFAEQEVNRWREAQERASK